MADKLKTWSIITVVALLAMSFLIFSNNKETTSPITSSVPASPTVQPITKVIIAELGYGEDESFPEVVFLPEENWVGEDMREVKKIFIEREVVPQHDYFNVFNEDAGNSTTENDDVDLVKVEFRETSRISKSTNKPEVILELYKSNGMIGGSIIADSKELEHVKELVFTWRPNCLGGCKLSEEYLDKFPEAK